MGEDETIENVLNSDSENVPGSETITDSESGGLDSETVTISESGGSESASVYYDNYLDVIIHYQAFQSAELIIIIFLCAAVLGSQIMRGFWGR